MSKTIVSALLDGKLSPVQLTSAGQVTPMVGRSPNHRAIFSDVTVYILLH